MTRKVLACILFIIMPLIMLTSCEKKHEPCNEEQLISDLESFFSDQKYLAGEDIGELEIIKRQTDEKEKYDKVYVKAISTLNGYKYITSHELNYGLYNNGWVLDSVEIYTGVGSENIRLPIAGPSDNELRDLLENWFATIGYDMYGDFNISADDIEILDKSIDLSDKTGKFSVSCHASYYGPFKLSVIDIPIHMEYYSDSTELYAAEKGIWSINSPVMFNEHELHEKDLAGTWAYYSDDISIELSLSELQNAHNNVETLSTKWEFEFGYEHEYNIGNVEYALVNWLGGDYNLDLLRGLVNVPCFLGTLPSTSQKVDYGFYPPSLAFTADSVVFLYKDPNEENYYSIYLSNDDSFEGKKNRPEYFGVSEPRLVTVIPPAAPAPAQDYPPAFPPHYH